MDVDPSWALPVAALEWIEDHLDPGSTILELGSGYGSKRLVRTFNLHSVEHDPEWAGRFPTVSYIYAPIVNGWYEAEPIRRLAPDRYGLLIVDGPPGTIGRLGMLEHLDLFGSPELVLVDDTHRLAEHQLERALASAWDLESVYYWAGKDPERSFSVLGRA